MANICTNTFYIGCKSEKINEAIINKLENLFTTKLDGEVTYIDPLFIEGYFNSKWDFPMYIFKDFFNEFEDVYMRCLSEEYGINYVAMNIYRDGNWLDEQTFDF